MIGRRLLLVAGVVLALTVSAMPVAAAGPSTNFTGIWVSTDVPDGSAQMLTVSSGSRPSVVYQDFYASGCDNNGVPTTHWTSAGKGSVDGDTLSVYFHTGGCGWFFRSGHFDEYVYDSGTDTLTDNWGIVWYRAT